MFPISLAGSPFCQSLFPRLAWLGSWLAASPPLQLSQVTGRAGKQAHRGRKFQTKCSGRGSKTIGPCPVQRCDWLSVRTGSCDWLPRQKSKVNESLPFRRFLLAFWRGEQDGGCRSSLVLVCCNLKVQKMLRALHSPWLGLPGKGISYGSIGV